MALLHLLNQTVHHANRIGNMARVSQLRFGGYLLVNYVFDCTLLI